MSYLLPSFVQKRLLKYALSQLGLVDTDSLDPDRLGVNLGQRSTFELRDVNLRLERVSTILRLPPNCVLEKASLSLVHVTVPADIYSSSIIIEAEQIQIRLRFKPEENESFGGGHRHTGRRDSPKEAKAATPRDAHSDAHDRGGVPSTTDLAESFLESEPNEEREQLRAAISDVLEDDQDEELGVGLHEGVSLPGFLAGFLKGIQDRLQLRIKDVSVEIDMDVRKNETSNEYFDRGADPMAALLTIKEVAVNSVVLPSADVHTSKTGKRLITLSQVDLALIAGSEVFSRYSTFNGQSAQSIPRSEGSTTPIGVPSPIPEVSESDSEPSMSRATILDPQSLHNQFASQRHDSPDALQRSMSSADGRFSDADENESESYPESERSLSSSQRGDNAWLEDPDYLEQLLRSQFTSDIRDQPEIPADVHESRGSTPRPVSPQSPGSSMNERMHDSYGEGDKRIQQSIERTMQEPELCSDNGQDDVSDNDHAQEGDQSFQAREGPATPTIEEPHNASQPSSQGNGSNEDLTESRIFSHEEARSLYMSAISHASSDADSSLHMPGGWGSPKGASRHQNLALSGLATAQFDLNTPTPAATAPYETDPSTPTLGPHEDTSTSSSIEHDSRVAKRVLEISEIVLWLPSFEGWKDKARTTETFGHQARGESSVAASVRSLSGSVIHDGPTDRTVLDSFNRLYPNPRHGQDGDASNPSIDEESPELIEVDMSNVVVKFDIACGWIATKMGQIVVATYKEQAAMEVSGPQAPGTPHNTTSESVKSQKADNVSFPLHLRLNLSSCTVNFLDLVYGHSYPFVYLPQPSSPQSSFAIESTILQATLRDTRLRFSPSESRLYVSKFTFGHKTGDILAFDKDLKMRETNRDSLTPQTDDIALLITRSVKHTKIDVLTLPIRLTLDLRCLEETSNWFGGLSTILELGSSIVSTSTTKSKKQVVAQQPRGVHFKPILSDGPVMAQRAAPSLITFSRSQGLVVDLVGERCSLKLETSAVKFAQRANAELRIDKGRLSGPYTMPGVSHSPIKAEITSLNLKYFDTPAEGDLERLVNLLTPSKDRYDEDDDIMLDTFIRQRKKGGVLRISFDKIHADVATPQSLEPLFDLGGEIAKFSSVTRYLPQDDRPGIITLLWVGELGAKVQMGEQIGSLHATCRNFEIAHVSVPSLMAARISTIDIVRNDAEQLLGEVVSSHHKQQWPAKTIPMIMVKYISDEMEPTVKLKLNNLRIEYSVPVLIAFTSSLGFEEDVTTEDIAANMATSFANLDIKPHHARSSTQSSRGSETVGGPARLAVVMRDCGIGLNPRQSQAKGLFNLTQAKFSGVHSKVDGSEAKLDIQKASIMVIDHVQNLDHTSNVPRRTGARSQSDQIEALHRMGYISVCHVSSAMAVVKVIQLDSDSERSVDIEVRDDLLFMETCADSTQTLIAIFNGLSPPTPPNEAVKYRTQIVPIQDMLASFSGEAFPADSESLPGSSPDSSSNVKSQGSDPADELEYVSDFSQAMLGHAGDHGRFGQPKTGRLGDSFHSDIAVSSSIECLDFHDDHFSKKSSVGGTAHRWDSRHNTYGLSNDDKLHHSPLRVRMRDVHIIWHLYDGYDWKRTRDTISDAVNDVQNRATEKRSRGGARGSPDIEDVDGGETVVGDCLFNSIYIEIPANRDPGELSRDINRDINDISETESYTTTATTVTGPMRANRASSKSGKRLRLKRSKNHKMTFELKGVSTDLVVFPPGSGETQSSLDVRVGDLVIFDHLPTSTWKKFATYMEDAGPRETGTSMIHLEVLNVKPVAELAASELVLKANVLPLRLHVDQDALDFMSRFFEFKDESVSAPAAATELPFLQRVEVNAVPVRLDFKPKRVDYAGLRSGRTTEFMNFFILDQADMVLRHVIIYGVSGFEKLGRTLNDIWMPDIKANQLPRVLAGLAPIRSLVGVGSGFKDLVVIPWREYKKDGRIVRSIQKGALSFAKTTANELVTLGAKLAIGTQTVLEGAEGLLNPQTTVSSRPTSTNVEDSDGSEEEKNQISLYADQPVGVVQGLRGGYACLERDLLLARDAIVAVPGEVIDSGSAGGAAKAVIKRAPTVVLRPAIGATKALGRAFLGAGNTLDPQNRRRAEDKYKRF